MSTSVLSVSQITSYIKLLFNGDKNLNNVFISGEISNFNNNYRSGHLYFSLKDDKAVIKAVMFSSNASRLRFLPIDGMKVLVSGRISVYEASGQYQLYVESMQPDGIGALAIAYEQLKNRLTAEGLFNEEHKLALPDFPSEIGVITSPTGAVIQDIKNVISRRYPIAKVILCPVAVQGESAAKQLTKAVRLFNDLNNADVIIIGRGGGSFEDLNCFNDEQLVREIYNSHIPVISAVGHETDFTLCDFVSDLRAPTPSAAAELAVPSRAELEKKLYDIYSRMEYIVSSKLYSEIQSVDKLTDCINACKPDNYIQGERDKLAEIEKKITSTVLSQLKLRKMEITALANAVNSLNPIRILQKGYATVTKNGEYVGTVGKLEENDHITVALSDGTVDCKVESVSFDKGDIHHERI